jgi:hypothetical protein
VRLGYNGVRQVNNGNAKKQQRKKEKNPTTDIVNLNKHACLYV